MKYSLSKGLYGLNQMQLQVPSNQGSYIWVVEQYSLSPCQVGPALVRMKLECVCVCVYVHVCVCAQMGKGYFRVKSVVHASQNFITVVSTRLQVKFYPFLSVTVALDIVCETNL